MGQLVNPRPTIRPRCGSALSGRSPLLGTWAGLDTGCSPFSLQHHQEPRDDTAVQHHPQTLPHTPLGLDGTSGAALTC